MKSYTVHLLQPQERNWQQQALPISLGKQIFATNPDSALREFFRQVVWGKQEIRCSGLVRESRLAGARFPFQVIHQSDRKDIGEPESEIETFDKFGRKVVVRYKFFPFVKLHDYGNEFTPYEKDHLICLEEEDEDRIHFAVQSGQMTEADAMREKSDILEQKKRSLRLSKLVAGATHEMRDYYLITKEEEMEIIDIVQRGLQDLKSISEEEYWVFQSTIHNSYFLSMLSLHFPSS